MTRRSEVQLFALLALLGAWGCSGSSSTPAPTGLQYTTTAAVYRTTFLITRNVPTSTGGPVTSWTVSPALPKGLKLDPATGAISGSPTVTAALASYTVTASNAGGATSASLAITVDPVAIPQDLPNTGQRLTPLAPPDATFTTLKPGTALVLTVPPPPTVPAGTNMIPPFVDVANWEVGQAVSSVVSPDGATLLVMTTGYNQVWAATTAGPVMANTSEWVFVFDNTTHPPTQLQALPLPNAFNGIAFDPTPGVQAFYVSGGMGNPQPVPKPAQPVPSDQVYVFARDNTGTWTPQPSLPLGHTSGLGLMVGNQGPTPVNSQVYMQPCSSGIALSQDGQTMVVVNYSNDSVSVFRGGFPNWGTPVEQDLRPGKVDPKNLSAAGVAGGGYPFWVAVKGSGATATAYVSSIRDREVVVLNLDAVFNKVDTVGPDGKPRVAARIKVKGQPNKLTLNRAQTLLYVVEEQADQVSVIDTASNQVVERIPVIAPPALLATLPTDLVLRTGANPNSATLSPDESQLWVSNGNHNAVSIITLDPAHKASAVAGLIPTGWYPTSITFSQDGQQATVINLKSPTGPNPDFCYSNGGTFPPKPYTCFPANAYNPMLTKAGFQTFRVPSTEQLAQLTAQVASNNRFSHVMSDGDAAVMAAVRQGIKHVIFILKENRTYDQILGELDVEGSDGDPDLADFGIAVTPNQNALAKEFVTLDRFLDTAEVSLDGWPWSTSARIPDVIERSYAVVYAGRELCLEGEGSNRGINVGLATLLERRLANPMTPDDPDLLPGQINVSGPDGPNNEAGTGYLWDNALRNGLTVRSYGFFVDTTLYASQLAPDRAIPPLHNPYASRTVVAISSSPSLAPYTDPYFRGFDNSFPDYYRYTEWARDFDAEPLANLSLVRFHHDHTGNYDTAIDLVNTPELQVADNDYAVGLLVQKVASSEHADDTLIFIVEDDAQDGGDHVDSHRSVAFIVGPYVKRGAVVSTQYNTLNFVRTIEEVLGLPPMNLNDALASPMADVFNNRPSKWSYTATPSAFLYNTRLPLPPKPAGLMVPKPTQDAAYWTRVTKGMDFTSEDKFDFAAYNRILWKGLRGDEPYPDSPSGIDLRKGRAALLEKHRAATQQKVAP
jgi:YVTN family beta-propeller protein